MLKLHAKLGIPSYKLYLHIAQLSNMGLQLTKKAYKSPKKKSFLNCSKFSNNMQMGALITTTTKFHNVLLEGTKVSKRRLHKQHNPKRT